MDTQGETKKPLGHLVACLSIPVRSEGEMSRKVEDESGIDRQSFLHTSVIGLDIYNDWIDLGISSSMVLAILKER